MCAMARLYQLEAARRAIGITNRLKSGPFRIRHTARVFKNYNRLRRLTQEQR